MVEERKWIEIKNLQKKIEKIKMSEKKDGKNFNQKRRRKKSRKKKIIREKSGKT